MSNMLAKFPTGLVGALLLVRVACSTTALAQQGAGPVKGEPKILVIPGDEQTAIAYYAKLQSILRFTLIDSSKKPSADLNGLIQYFGYRDALSRGLSAADLEELDPKLLMPKTPADFDLLAQSVENPKGFKDILRFSILRDDRVVVSRFFAPKIVDYVNVNDPTLPPVNSFVPGWRKLVSLRSQAGSRADKAGIRTAYILFNFLERDVTKNPFEKLNISKNNQVILVPAAVKPGGDSAYFAVFLEKPQYRLGTALQGVAFDFPFKKGQGNNYFVPVACAQCHGQEDDANPANLTYPKARLNYLDTDQWNDVLPLDFPDLAKIPTNAVIFDGGKVPGTDVYDRAVRAMMRINTAAYYQNALVDKADFKIKAAAKWLGFHSSIPDKGPVPLSQRILSVDPSVKWNPANSDEMKLLGLLNRYCFRCHGSIKYNVFDKQGVMARKADIQVYVKNGYMPQGRVLQQAERDAIINLVAALKKDLEK